MSNILSGALSLTRFSIGGDITDDQFLFGIQCETFHDISETADERSGGFVNFFNMTDTSFSTIEAVKIDHYFVVGLRVDVKKIPAALFAIEVGKASKEFIDGHPTLSFVPKAEKEQIRDRVRSKFLVKIPPTPSFCQIIWNLETKELLIGSQTEKTVETVQALMHQAFPMIRLERQAPMRRLCDIHPEMKEHDQAQTDSMLESIEANQGYWFDMFKWLLYRTLNSDSRYQVTEFGPLLGQQPFTAFLDNKLVLVGSGHEGQQKVVVSGSQDHYLEAKAALRQCKEITDVCLMANLCDDGEIKMNLNSTWMQMKGAKLIEIRPESDPDDDQQAENVAAFITRMGAIAEAQQILDSLVVEFMRMRTDKDHWAQMSKLINEWLEG